MAKILKNTTGSVISLLALGRDIPASGQITVDVEDYEKLASNSSVVQVDPLIDSGSIVVNNGVADLGVDYGKDFLDFPDNTKSISFIQAGSTYRSTVRTAFDAFEGVHKHLITAPQPITSTLNGNAYLDTTNHSFQIVSGTATGFSVHLPNASELPLGNSYEIFNKSTQSILIKDYLGGSIVTVNPSSNIIMKLESAPTAAGSWIFVINSTTATGITSYVVSSSTTFSTSSSSYVVVTGFSVTPVSGRYFASYSSEIKITSNNRLAQCAIYVGGSIQATTPRLVQGVGSNFEAIQSTVGEVTLNGSQSVDIRVNVSSGSIDIKQRSLILIRLGS